MARIDTSKSFSKNVGSFMGAWRLLRTLTSESISYTRRVSGRTLLEAFGNTKDFNWNYDGWDKRLKVIYNSPDRQPKDAKTKYYIIWIEGLSPKRGEKVKCFTNYGYDITTSMGNAKRIKQEDIETVKHYLKRHGVADWVLDSPNTFVPTSYAPAGTILNSNREYLG